MEVGEQGHEPAGLRPRRQVLAGQGLGQLLFGLGLVGLHLVRDADFLCCWRGFFRLGCLGLRSPLGFLFRPPFSLQLRLALSLASATNFMDRTNEIVLALLEECFANY